MQVSDPTRSLFVRKATAKTPFHTARHHTTTPMQVFVRLRPLLKHEQNAKKKTKATMVGKKKKTAVKADWDCVTVNEDNSEQLILQAPTTSANFHKQKTETYTFSKIFDVDSTQEDVYSATMEPMLSKFRQGKNGLIFAYGITNSGKTYTMQGDLDRKDEAGLVPRALSDILQSDVLEEFRVVVSFLEIYNERLYDLLLDAEAIKDEDDSKKNKAKKQSRKKKVPNTATKKWIGEASRNECYLRQNAKGDVYVEGIQEVEVNTSEEALALLKSSKANQISGATSLNAHSSRSHSVFTIKLFKRDTDGLFGASQTFEEETMSQRSTASTQSRKPKRQAAWARLSIVDLAGAERTKRTENTGERLAETLQINTSLMKLGRCLETLRYNQAQMNRGAKGKERLRIVPFRESKVTMLFKDYLCGWGTTTMITTASSFPYDFDETLHALKYAAIAKEIIIQPRMERMQANPYKKKEEEDLFLEEVMLDDELEENSDSMMAEDEEQEEYIDSLLDQIFELKKQLVEKQKEIVKVEADTRAEVVEDMSEQITDVEQVYQAQLEQERFLTEQKYERKMLLWQKEMMFRLSAAQDQAIIASSSSSSNGAMSNELIEDLLARQKQGHATELSRIKAQHSAELAAAEDGRRKLVEENKKHVSELQNRVLELGSQVDEKGFLLTEYELQIEELETEETALREEIDEVANEYEAKMAELTASHIHQSDAMAEQLSVLQKDFDKATKQAVKQEKKFKQQIDKLTKQNESSQEEIENLRVEHANAIAVAVEEHKKLQKSLTKVQNSSEKNIEKAVQKAVHAEKVAASRALKTALKEQEASFQAETQTAAKAHEQALESVKMELSTALMQDASEEQSAAVAKLQKNHEKALKKAVKAAETAANKAQKAALKEVMSDAKATLIAAKEEWETEMSEKIESAVEAACEELTAKHEASLVDAKRQAGVARGKAEQTMKKAHGKEITALTSAHEKELEAQHDAHDEALTALKAELKTAKEELAKQQQESKSTVASTSSSDITAREAKLQKKVERLVMEYKKLKGKYTTLKETVKSSGATIEKKSEATGVVYKKRKFGDVIRTNDTAASSRSSMTTSTSGLAAKSHSRIRSVARSEAVKATTQDTTKKSTSLFGESKSGKNQFFYGRAKKATTSSSDLMSSSSSASVDPYAFDFAKEESSAKKGLWKTLVSSVKKKKGTKRKTVDENSNDSAEDEQPVTKRVTRATRRSTRTTRA